MIQQSMGKAYAVEFSELFAEYLRALHWILPYLRDNWFMDSDLSRSPVGLNVQSGGSLNARTDDGLNALNPRSGASVSGQSGFSSSENDISCITGISVLWQFYRKVKKMSQIIQLRNSFRERLIQCLIYEVKTSLAKNFPNGGTALFLEKVGEGE